LGRRERGFGKADFRCDALHLLGIRQNIADNDTGRISTRSVISERRYSLDRCHSTSP
jgi:hypothetical protein